MKKAAAGIDIGGTNTVIGLTDEAGRILSESRISTREFTHESEFTKALIQVVRSQADETQCHLEGIGIGAPNGNYFSGSIEYAPNLPWKGVIPLAAQLEAAFQLPTVLTNDANAGAVGEMLYGGAKTMKDFIFITLGTGVGSGIVSGGKLLYGHDGFAGEIGHVIVEKGGRPCGCGRKGCLETYASAGGMVKTALKLLQKNDFESRLKNYPPEAISSKIIYNEALKGDKTALQVFEQTAEILGFALANSAAYTSPEAIFLFGGPAEAGDLLFKPVKRSMEQNMLNLYKNKIALLPSKLKAGQAALLGAAALVWNHIK